MGVNKSGLLELSTFPTSSEQALDFGCILPTGASVSAQDLRTYQFMLTMWLRANMLFYVLAIGGTQCSPWHAEFWAAEGQPCWHLYLCVWHSLLLCPHQGKSGLVWQHFTYVVLLLQAELNTVPVTLLGLSRLCPYMPSPNADFHPNPIALINCNPKRNSFPESCAFCDESSYLTELLENLECWHRK